MTFRCFLPAWILAWVVAIFLPSVFLAYLGVSPAAAAMGNGFDRLLATTWKVADGVGPVVKLMIGGLLLLGFLGLERWAREPKLRYALGMGVGLVVVAITIALVPAELSRGFAQALTGVRFDTVAAPLYLSGGVIAGAAFVFAADKCRRRSGG